jgi:hypothetical protein
MFVPSSKFPLDGQHITGKLRSMVREMLAEELGEIDGLVRDK